MHRATFRRSLAVLTLAVVGSLTAFLAGARVGAAINGHVNGLTLAHSPMPQLPAPEPAHAVTVIAKK